MNPICPFCKPASDRVIATKDLALALWDGYPVSPGHALVIPRRHIRGWFEATGEERDQILELLDRVKETIEQGHRPQGYNLGMNIGAVAGQTVPHLHLHVIPRYQGDVEDPRGGVRWVVPDKARYWE